MQKGKFGFSVWLYPFISLWLILTGSILGSLVIVGFAAIVEKDEWTTKQCLQVLMLSIYWSFYQTISNLFIRIPLIGSVFSIIDSIIYIVFIVVIIVLGLLKLRKGMDMNLPGKGIINSAYGLVMQPVQQPSTYTAPEQPASAPEEAKDDTTAQPPAQ